MFQTDLGLDPTAVIWTVHFSYKRIARCRGVLVDMQCRDTRKFAGVDKREAVRAARDWLYDQFHAEFMKLGGNMETLLAQITLETTLIRPRSFNLISATA